MDELTQKQRDILDYLISCRKQGFIPSHAELATHFGFASINAARNHLVALQRKGFIRLLNNQSRNIQLLVDIDDDANSPEGDYSPLKRLSVLGSVHAGNPSIAQEDIVDHVSIDNMMFKGEHLVALKVQGNSMIGAGIHNGDIVIVRQQQYAENRDIVVAIIDQEEGTLKRYFKKDDGVLLRPENEAEQEIMIQNKFLNDCLFIYGKVIGVLRILA